MLGGLRGAAPSDINALIEQVERIAKTAHAWQGQIVEMDITPLIVLPKGQGTRVADAVIFPAPTV